MSEELQRDLSKLGEWAAHNDRWKEEERSKVMHSESKRELRSAEQNILGIAEDDAMEISAQFAPVTLSGCTKNNTIHSIKALYKSIE